MRNLCDAQVTKENAGVGDCSEVSSRNHPIYEELYSCIGKSTCKVEVTNNVPIGGRGACKTSEASIFFVQFYCRVGDDELDSKRRTALLASAITIFAVLGLFSLN